jgi:hypothetical protein
MAAERCGSDIVVAVVCEQVALGLADDAPEETGDCVLQHDALCNLFLL